MTRYRARWSVSSLLLKPFGACTLAPSFYSVSFRQHSNREFIIRVSYFEIYNEVIVIVIALC